MTFFGINADRAACRRPPVFGLHRPDNTEAGAYWLKGFKTVHSGNPMRRRMTLNVSQRAFLVEGDFWSARNFRRDSMKRKHRIIFR